MAVMKKFKRGPGGILTVDELAEAIKNIIDRKGMKDDVAKDRALHILNFFGYGDRIVDNMLEPDDRNVFYMLEDYGILVSEREEVTLYDGREWRIHYWLFKKDKILELANNSNKQSNTKSNQAFESVYDDLSDEIWTLRNNTLAKTEK